MALMAAQLGVVSRLLDEALPLDEPQRQRWLDALPPEHAPLKPVLRKLLTQSGESPGEGPDRIWQLGGSADAQPTIPAAGEQIGPYKLIGELGRGGMGTVWLAERVDGVFRRVVALKLPHAAFVDRGLARRVARERSVLANLSHPNIAQLYDAGWSDDGRPYLALEYVEGVSIDRWCREQRLNVRARVRLFVEVVRAVAYAHARLVVHRDIKPANVLVAMDGRTKLLDFGVAKLLVDETTAVGETELTQIAGRPLTLNYAAPEQVTGEPISTAADIYALGVVLFELISGRGPYRLLGKSRREIEDAILYQEPPGPSSLARDKASERATRGDLDAIVLKALKKPPENRYGTAEAFADDLEAYLKGRAVSAERETLWYRTRRFAGRHKVMIVAALLATIALGVGLAVASWQAQQAREQAATAAAINDFVLSIIRRADPKASQLTRESDRVLLNAADERIKRELRSRPELQLKMRVAIATAYKNRGDIDEGARVLRSAIDHARGAVRADNLDLLAARVMFGQQMAAEAVRGRDYPEALQDLEQAIETLRALGKAAIPLLVDGLVARVSLRSASESLDRASADRELRAALALALENLGPGDQRTLRAAARLAASLFSPPTMPSQEALDLLEPVIRATIENARLAESDPDLIDAQALRGRMLCGLKRADEGLPLLERTLAVAESAHGVKGAIYRSTLYEYGIAQELAGKTDQAIEAGVSAYALVAADEPFASELRENYGMILARHLLVAHQPALAEPFLDEAAASVAAIESPQERANRMQLINGKRAWMLIEFGEYSRARPLLDAALAKAAADHNTTIEQVGRNLQSLAPASAPDRKPPLPRIGAPGMSTDEKIKLVLQRYPLRREVAEYVASRK